MAIFLATFLRPLFAASCEQHISDHSKFALGPRYVVNSQSVVAEIRRGKKRKIDRRRRRKKETTGQKYNVLPGAAIIMPICIIRRLL